MTSEPVPDQIPPAALLPPAPAVRRRLYSDGTRARITPGAPQQQFPFNALKTAPIIVDAIYQGSGAVGYRADPLCKLIPGCPNEGGFRAIGGRSFGKCRLLVLSSSGADPDWPDRLDAESGIYTYFGDNKKPGHELHDTPKGGNELLRRMFAASVAIHERAATPPILVFIKTGNGRDVMFRGLAVPTQSQDEGLVAIWRQTDGMRFQNYKAKFELLDCKEIPRAWVEALASNNFLEAEAAAPEVWKAWIARGARTILRAPKTVQHRTKEAQLPSPNDTVARKILSTLRSAFAGRPHDFEFVAAEVFRLIEPRVFDLEITKKSADGGRDAIGRLRIGGDELDSDGIYADFALEAKAYAEDNGVGVKETSRLISRLRHRQFGVIVTTSYISPQAYQELRADQHPVVIISAVDIARIMRSRGLSQPAQVEDWIAQILALGGRAG
jgi:hypothetical protein